MRLVNSVRNTSYALIGEIVSTILNFLSRTFFIWILGVEYLGINGLFANILSMLSLAELGVGNAITYNLYKPLAENNHEKIMGLMCLYRKAYRIIGISVFFIGCFLLPFLDVIIKDRPDIDSFYLIYFLFILNSTITYFYSYKRSIIIADQKSYLNTKNLIKFKIIQIISQIFILVITKSYILFLIIQILTDFLANICISREINKIYPYLKENNKDNLDFATKKNIFKNILALMSHKFGNVIVNGTDNILISSFLGIYWVGIYSNYSMIIGIVNRFMIQIFSSIMSSVGNVNALEATDKSYNIYKKIFFMNFYLYGFCSITLWNLINPFISFWLGEKYILNENIVIILIFNFFIMGMRQTTTIYNTTLGLFWNDRYRPLIEAIINLSVSIILVKYYGIIGIFFGTFISTLTTSFWIEPYLLYKHKFSLPVSLYFKTYSLYMIVTIFVAIIIKIITINFIKYNFCYIILRLLLCIIIINLCFILVFINTEEMKYFLNMFKKIIQRILKKR